MTIRHLTTTTHHSEFCCSEVASLESKLGVDCWRFETGWQIIQQDDITGAFCASIERMIAAEEKQSESLRALRGNEANETAQANWRYKLQAVADGLILREFFSVVPA